MFVPILFVHDKSSEKIFFDESAVSSKPKLVIGINEIINEAKDELEIGDKVFVSQQMSEGEPQFIVNKILARKQPVATSDHQYMKKLKIHIQDSKHELDYNKVNKVLEKIIGISLVYSELIPEDYHLLITLDGEDFGTSICPFNLLMLKQEMSTNFPLKIAFPQVSKKTLKYLQKVVPNEKIDLNKIFAFRLIHFLLHLLGYHADHSLQKLEESINAQTALIQGDPSKTNSLNFNNVCLCDWEMLHFLATQPDSKFQPIEKMMCGKCKSRHLVGVGFNDIETIIMNRNESIKQNKKEPTLRFEKRIFYVVESKKNSLIMNETPFKSKKTVDITSKSWIDVSFDTFETCSSISVNKKLISSYPTPKVGDKLLIRIKLESNLENKKFDVTVKPVYFKVEKVLKRNVKIIKKSKIFSRIRPFKQKVILKIGPEIEAELIKRIAKRIRKITNWNIKIDYSSYEDLKQSYESLKDINEKWKKTDQKNRGELVVKVRDVLYKLPKVSDVEDTFCIPVFIFPDNFFFLDDVFGTAASGLSLEKTFAVVAIFSGLNPLYRICYDCEFKPVHLFREEMTSLFVIHEVLHVAAGLKDHKGCYFCSYNKEEMQQLRRYYCEKCIRNGDDEVHKNCLMSYGCLQCIVTRIKNVTLHKILCEDCKKQLLPQEQFAARHAKRVNEIRYRDLLQSSLHSFKNDKTN